MNPGLVLALQSLHAHLFSCLQPGGTADRLEGGTPGRTEPAPGTGGRGDVFAMKRARLSLTGKKNIKSHLEILLIFFTGFKVEF